MFIAHRDMEYITKSGVSRILHWGAKTCVNYYPYTHQNTQADLHFTGEGVSKKQTVLQHMQQNKSKHHQVMESKLAGAGKNAYFEGLVKASPFPVTKGLYQTSRRKKMA